MTQFSEEMADISEVITVLMYLFKNYMEDNCELNAEVEQLYVELEEQGFTEDAVDKAFDWLKTLRELQSAEMQYTLTNQQARRIYTAQELSRLDQDSLTFLNELVQKNIVTLVDHEAIVTLALTLDLDIITLPITKWITMMVLFNNPNGKQALAHVEALVLNETSSTEAH